jgi:hypothetical protein
MQRIRPRSKSRKYGLRSVVTYIVCLNEEERRKDARDREAIVAHLKEQLRSGDKSLVGNKGYHKRDETIRGPRVLQFPGLAAQARAREPNETNRSAMGMERSHSRAGCFAASRSQFPGQTLSIPQSAYGRRFASGACYQRGATTYIAGTPVRGPGQKCSAKGLLTF